MPGFENDWPSIVRQGQCALRDPVAVELAPRCRPDELWSIDFHRLEFAGRPLAARVPVRYSLDLGGVREVDRQARTLLIVADPTGDLPRAREEGAAVALAAADGSTRVRVLEAGGASLERFHSELETSWLLHYAGHGLAAGIEGYESSLPYRSSSGVYERHLLI